MIHCQRAFYTRETKITPARVLTRIYPRTLLAFTIITLKPSTKVILLTPSLILSPTLKCSLRDIRNYFTSREHNRVS